MHQTGKCDDKLGLDRCDLGRVWVNEPITNRQFLESILKDLPAKARILDAGAGEGKLSEFFRSHGHDYLGIDSGVGSPSWDYNNVRALDLYAVADHLPHNYFNAITLIQVMEHLARPSDALAGLAKVLKDGCRIYLTVPMGQSCHQVPYDFYRYTPYGIRALAEQAGLSAIRIQTQDAGDLDSNARRLVWSIQHSMRNQNALGKVVLRSMHLVLRLFRRIAKHLDRKSTRHIHPVGFVAVLTHQDDFSRCRSEQIRASGSRTQHDPLELGKLARSGNN
jgi:SAM-dependent methyltransferase